MKRLTKVACFPWVFGDWAKGFLLALCVFGLAGVYPLHGQQPPGKDCYCFPAGGKAGTTIAVRLGGTDWTSDTQFFVHDPRVKLEILSKPSAVLIHEPPYWFDIKSFANDPRLPREVSARWILPPNMPAGPVQWSVANANGASIGGVFMVGEGESLVENEGRYSPQLIPHFPITVEGRLGRIEEVDYYSFKAPQTGPLTCQTMARALGNDLNLVVQVRNETGQLVSGMFDTSGVDGSMTFSVEKERVYLVSVRDLDHRGYRSFTYRLSLALSPGLLGARPAGGKPGTKQTVAFFGQGLLTGKPQLEIIQKEVSFPQEPEEAAFFSRVATPFGITNEIPMFLGVGAEQIEPNRIDTKPISLVVPGAMNGIISKKGEVDAYTFVGKKGESWIIGVQAKKLGSPLDATVELLGPDGKSLGEKDDSGGSTDPRLSLTLGADGLHTLLVGDVSGRKPDGTSVYRLVVRKHKDDFSLQAGGVVFLPLGGKAELTINALREGNFKEPILITLKGLSAGIKLPKEMVIPPGSDVLKLSLECAKDASVEATLVEVSGTAKVNNQPVTKSAHSVVPGVAFQKVLVAITMKPPFKVKAAEADGGRRIPRGATHLAEILIDRTDGFKGEIVLDMAADQQRHRQGIRGDSVVVPADKQKVFYPVFAPEWLETTRTSRIGLIAMAKVPDPKGVVREVMAPMEGQITMSMEGALMKLGVARSASQSHDLIGVMGKPMEIPLKLARAPQLTGPVEVELIVDPRLTGLVWAEPLLLNEKATGAVLKVHAKADPRLLGIWNLLAKAKAKRNGFPVISETAFEVEWVAAPK